MAALLAQALIRQRLRGGQSLGDEQHGSQTKLRTGAKVAVVGIS